MLVVGRSTRSELMRRADIEGLARDPCATLVYSGAATDCAVQGLRADTEYLFTVCSSGFRGLDNLRQVWMGRGIGGWGGSGGRGRWQAEWIAVLLTFDLRLGLSFLPLLSDPKKLYFLVLSQ